MRVATVFALLLGFFLTLFVSSGCSRKAESGNTISGKVTLKGNPVTGGTLFLVSAKGPPDIRVTILPDGTFKHSGIPPGEMLVSIETESVKGMTGDPTGGLADKAKGLGGDPTKIKTPKLPDVGQPGKMPVYVPINKKYADPKTSGLTWTINEGAQVKDFDLKD